jgi:hypothetical protein
MAFLTAAALHDHVKSCAREIKHVAFEATDHIVIPTNWEEKT